MQAYLRTNALIDASAVPEMTSPCGEALLHCVVFCIFLEKVYKGTRLIDL